jgi:hypothetical protein
MTAIGWKGGVLILAFAAGCSSNSSSSMGPPDSAADSGPADVQSAGSPSDSAADSGPGDVQSVDSSSDGGAGCYMVSGSGSTQECAFSSCAVSGSSCAALPGSTFGSCPSSELYGCCIQTLVLDGGGNCLQGTCYYSLDAGRTPESNCDADMYLRLPYSWDITPP